MSGFTNQHWANKSFQLLWRVVCHSGSVICLMAVQWDSVLVCPIPCKHAVGILICLASFLNQL